MPRGGGGYSPGVRVPHLSVVGSRPLWEKLVPFWHLLTATQPPAHAGKREREKIRGNALGFFSTIPGRIRAVLCTSGEEAVISVE